MRTSREDRLARALALDAAADGHEASAKKIAEQIATYRERLPWLMREQRTSDAYQLQCKIDKMEERVAKLNAMVQGQRARAARLRELAATPSGYKYIGKPYEWGVNRIAQRHTRLAAKRYTQDDEWP